ncbi:hypothetical protein PMKS-002248 [Pichia membranifaciens]|uniref:Uncharacterized protein n=1 Tax=Pichia membranifaciens TaxID=4926 RepID=A0A1Q2YHA8_9ASCO|nr:hypothetical protein PMKS-002248 [Pichia membranifaciens]
MAKSAPILPTQLSRSSSSSSMTNDPYPNSIPTITSSDSTNSKNTAPRVMSNSGNISDLHIQPVPKSNFSKNIAVSNAIVLASRLHSHGGCDSLVLIWAGVVYRLGIATSYDRHYWTVVFPRITKIQRRVTRALGSSKAST